MSLPILKKLIILIASIIVYTGSELILDSNTEKETIVLTVRESLKISGMYPIYVSVPKDCLTISLRISRDPGLDLNKNLLENDMRKLNLVIKIASQGDFHHLY